MVLPGEHEPLLEENARLPNDGFKSTVLKSINEFILEELAGDDISRCFTTKSLLGNGWPKGQDGNFRIDKQPPSLEGPSRQRYAVQVNDNAPDSALKKVTRTAGAGGKAFKRSSATVAQIEVNNFINQGENTSDILREAFYQSMIPDQVYNGAMLNHIYVDERGAIFIKKNEDYQELLEQNAVKADKKIKKANHKGSEKK